MVTYVKAKDTDTWHWCTNCTQYPKKENIKESTTTKPTFDLCNQCKAKETDKNCTT